MSTTLEYFEVDDVLSTTVTGDDGKPMMWVPIEKRFYADLMRAAASKERDEHRICIITVLQKK